MHQRKMPRMFENNVPVHKTRTSRLTIRRLLLGAGVISIFLVALSVLQAYTHEPEPLDLSDLQDPGIDDLAFRPRTCVFKNGTCVPLDEANVPIQGKGLYVHKDQFYLDGRPFRILSGSFHYFRTQPAQWGDRLLKMKAAGLNTVMTYIPWNLHEQRKGQYIFGSHWDLASFIQQVQKVGFKMIVRPGPYICAEWEFGGLPSWLLSDPDMRVRSSWYKPYLDQAERYLSKLLPLLSTFSYKKGGPIIAFQVENEFGSYGHDPKYMEFLLKQFANWNIEELFFTSDGRKQFYNGSIPNILETVNFKKEPIQNLNALRDFQPGKPLMVTEFWSGWFHHWGKNNSKDFESLSSFKNALEYILKRNASINFYMFVGGTNFGFWNGANMDTKSKPMSSDPTITSYDYEAPISESGDITAKYLAARKLIVKYGLAPEDLPPVPANTPKMAYDAIKCDAWLQYDDMIDLILSTRTQRNMQLMHDSPLPMELLNINNGGGQGYGWLLYRNQIPPGSTIVIDGEMHDYAQVLLNYNEIKYLNQTNYREPINCGSSQRSVLDLFVENAGRVNFRILDGQRKGITGKVLLNGKPLQAWTHIPFEFDEDFIGVLRSSAKWKTTAEQTIRHQPKAYRAYLDIHGPPKDTFLNMAQWTKGIVILNGFNIGRYWNVGPQQTLYIPAPLLVKGRNEIIVFELQEPGSRLQFSDRHFWKLK